MDNNQNDPTLTELFNLASFAFAMNESIQQKLFPQLDNLPQRLAEAGKQQSAEDQTKMLSLLDELKEVEELVAKNILPQHHLTICALKLLDSSSGTLTSLFSEEALADCMPEPARNEETAKGFEKYELGFFAKLCRLGIK